MYIFVRKIVSTNICLFSSKVSKYFNKKRKKDKKKKRKTKRGVEKGRRREKESGPLHLVIFNLYDLRSKSSSVQIFRSAN